MDPDRDLAPLVPAAGDPYYPLEDPSALVESEPEEDPDEDPVEDPEEVNYEPADIPGYLVEDDSDDEGILEDIPLDDAQPEECLSEEEVSFPSTPAAIPYYQPYLQGGRGPWMRTTPGTGAQPDIYSFVDRSISGHARMSDMHRALPDVTPYLTSGQKRKAPEGPAHYEIGEPSQAPPPVPPSAPPPAPPPAVCTCQAHLEVLTRRIQSLEDHTRSTHATSRSTIRRVDALEEEERQDTEAISTLYQRYHTARTDLINLQIRSGHLENTEGTTQGQISAAERTITELRGENRQLREQFDELVRYLVSRFGC